MTDTGNERQAAEWGPENSKKRTRGADGPSQRREVSSAPLLFVRFFVFSLCQRKRGVLEYTIFTGVLIGKGGICNLDLNKKNLKTLLILAFSCILFYLGIKNLGAVLGVLSKVIDIIFPFILGAAIAFIINVPMSRIEFWLFHRTEKVRKGRRLISFTLTLLLVVGIIVVAMYIIIPQIGETLMVIGAQLPIAFRATQNWVMENLEYFSYADEIFQQLSVDWGQIIQKLSVILQNAATSVLNSGLGVVNNIINAVISFFIGFVFSVYLLMSKEKLAGQGKQILYALFSEGTADKILYVLSLTARTFSKFISGQCLEACILGFMFFVAMTVFKMPYAMLIAVLIAFTALIPMVGAFIGCAVGVLLILMVSPLKALIFLIMFLLLQQLEGNLVYPKVVGNSVGLPSVWVLVAITVGGNLMGVAGMILFIPVCSVLYALFRLFVKHRLSEKKVAPEKWQEKSAFEESVMLKNSSEKILNSESSGDRTGE